MKSLIQFAKDIHLLHTWSAWVDDAKFQVNYKYNRDFWWYTQIQLRECTKCHKKQSRTFRISINED